VLAGVLVKVVFVGCFCFCFWLACPTPQGGACEIGGGLRCVILNALPPPSAGEGGSPPGGIERIETDRQIKTEDFRPAAGGRRQRGEGVGAWLNLTVKNVFFKSCLFITLRCFL